MTRARELAGVEDGESLHQRYEELSAEVLGDLMRKMGPERAPPQPETRLQLQEYYK